MENKINIAELLKDCPKGMELDCIIFNNPVKYESANDNGSYPISVRTEEGELFYLNKYGCLYDRFDSKCAIFPKGKTTWEGFIPLCIGGDAFSEVIDEMNRNRAFEECAKWSDKTQIEKVLNFIFEYFYEHPHVNGHICTDSFESLEALEEELIKIMED